MENIFNKLTEKAVHAMVSAIQVYNNPTSVYRAETFSILAINGWELLLKAKWLKEHGDDISSLHVIEKRDGEQRVKRSRSGNALTEGLTSLVRKLDGRGMLRKNVQLNLNALVEMRDTTIHFYDETGRLEIEVHGIASANVWNFASVMKEWFAHDLSEKYHFALMPLSFVSIAQTEATVVSGEVENFLDFVDSLESESDKSDTEHFVAVGVEVNLTRKPKSDAPEVRITNNPDAREVRLTEEQISERYPLSFSELVAICKERYTDCKINQRFHSIKKTMWENPRFAFTKRMDPKNPKSPYQTFYSRDVLQEFDKHYTRK